MIWFVSLFISLATVVYIASPFQVRRRGLSATLTADEDALHGRRDMLLRSLKELEFDHGTGKIDSDEYHTIRAGVVSEAASVLTLLESPVQSASDDGEAAAEAEILIKRAQRRRKNGAGKSNRSDSLHCRCGHALSAEDRFCASCGLPRTSC